MSTDPSGKKLKSTSYPRDALNQAEVVIEGWSQVGERLMVPNLDLVQLKEKLQQALAYIERAEEMKEERAKAVQARNVCLSELWDLTKRVRNSAKATFGDYSPELDLLMAAATSMTREH
jgi:hypothetical protein